MTHVSKPEVSVVLPTYNRAHSISKAITSVLEQTFPKFELIVVDDGSTDETKSVIESFDDKRIIYEKLKANRGVSAARNRGITIAQSELIAFQDSDDLWHPTKLARQLEEFSTADSNLGVVYTSALKIYQDGSMLLPDPKLNPKSGKLLDKMLFSNLVPLPTAVVKRECFKAVGGFDENLSTQEDWEFFLRVAKKYSFAHIDEPLLESPFSPGGVNNTIIEEIVTAIEFMKKKHLSDFQNCKGSLANLEYFVACKACHQGQWKLGQRHLVRAVKMNPSNFKFWAASMLAFGSHVHFRKLVKFGR